MTTPTKNLLGTIGEWLQIITSNLGTLVILLVIGHFVIGGLWEFKQSTTGIRRYDPRLEYSPFDDMSDDDKMTFAEEFAEAREHIHFEPYSLWRLDPFKGKFVNVNENGTRKTIKSPKPNAKKVFMLGGSTMWGEGATDSGTIASHLQAKLGDDYDVTNYGEVAYNSVQEFNVLLDRLAKGDIPDIVVFYDGVNDGFASVYSPGVPRGIHTGVDAFQLKSANLSSTALELYNQSGWGHLKDLWGQVAQKLHLPAPNKGKWDDKIAPKIETNIIETLHDYDALITQVKALEKAYGFKAYFFWQPNLFSLHREPIGFEMEPYNNASPTWRNAMKNMAIAAKQHFRGRESDNVYYIGDLFDDSTEPVFMDWCHVPSKANEQVAGIMFSEITPQ